MNRSLPVVLVASPILASLTISAAHAADAPVPTVTVIGTTPLPGALPLFASGLGMMGFLGWRRKRKPAA